MSHRPVRLPPHTQIHVRSRWGRDSGALDRVLDETVTQLVERLQTEIRSMIRDCRLAAEVNVIPSHGVQGPFVEVNPTSDSGAPTMSVHVLDTDSVALSIGPTASADCAGSTALIVETVRSVAGSMFEGKLQEVTRSHRGEVLKSTLLVITEAGPEVLWTHSSAGGPLGFRSRSRVVATFPDYLHVP